MFTVYLYALLSVVVVSCVSFAGLLTLSIKEVLLRKYLHALVGLAIGALLGDAFIHLLPEAFETIDSPTHVALLIIVGILAFFILEKTLHWHHDTHDIEDSHATHPVGKIVLASDGLHNFIDGLIIGASYLVNVQVGVATTIAVILHEIPQEIGDFGVLLHAGYTKHRALWLNFLSALSALAGTLLALILNETVDFLTVWLLPLAAGGFIYIAMADLLPELHKTKKVPHSILQIVTICIGIGAMLFMLLME